MIRVAILGGGNIGQTLSGLIGARADVAVTLWSRSWQRAETLTLTVFVENEVAHIGAARVDPDIYSAVDDADVIILTVPTHIGAHLYNRLRKRAKRCAMLVFWEGSGSSIRALRDEDPVAPLAVGLQKSPIFARKRERGRSVEVFGVRTAVVASLLFGDDATKARTLLESLIPCAFEFAPSYDCVTISPGNPLIHPARLYSHKSKDISALAAPSRIYSDWHDDASQILLRMHCELASLRDALGLPEKFVPTLVDRSPAPKPVEVTEQLRSISVLADLQLPIIATQGETRFDLTHRFFLEDIDEGLRGIINLAHAAGVTMPTAEAILGWYQDVLAFESQA